MPVLTPAPPPSRARRPLSFWLWLTLAAYIYGVGAYTVWIEKAFVRGLIITVAGAMLFVFRAYRK